MRSPLRSASPEVAGLATMLVAAAVFVAMGTAVKLLRSEGFGPIAVTFWRVAPGLPLVYWELRRQGGSLRPHRPNQVLLRAVFGTAAMTTSFWALGQLRLGEHTMIQLTQPVLVALLAPALLGEQLHRRAAVALGLALAGAVTIIQPPATFAAPPLIPALVCLVSALTSAVAQISIRASTADRGAERPADSPALVVFHFTAIAAVICLGIGLATGELRQLPPWRLSGLIAVMALCGAVGQILMSRAYSQARAPLVAMISYSGIPLALGLDVWIWGERIRWHHCLGGLLLVSAGTLLVGPRIVRRFTASFRTPTT